MLDFGCGQGRYLPVVARLLPEAELHGADVSAVALELAARRGVRAELQLAEPDGLPETADESIDLALLVDVIEHVATPVRRWPSCGACCAQVVASC